MLSLGWSEIALTVIIIVIIVGPKEIPNFLRQMGKLSKSLKKASREFKKSLDDLAEEKDLSIIKKSISNLENTKDDFNPSKIFKDEINSIKETVEFTDKEISEINSKIKKD